MIQTTCPYCGVGCGIIAEVNQTTVTIKGDKTHPANFGRLCSKGSALADTLDLNDRLLYPELHHQRVSWDTALNKVANELQRIIREHGAEAIAFYVSGQLLTEDYYVANKLMKGFLGTANIDTNSRLCMASSVAGHKRAFGSDTVSGCYEDLELADLVVLVGSNLAWCHPILYQRLVAAKEQRPRLKIVVIDPRYTATSNIADLHLSIRSGTDTWLFNGLLNFLRTHDHLDYEFLEAHTHGSGAALKAARESAATIPQVAQLCGLNEMEVAEFYRLFAKTEQTVTVYSQGVNQSSAGTDKVNSIINCHLATGRIGKPGATPFSVTGQPNAMGGREVGALANQLVAHMDFKPEQLDLVQQFWQSPVIAQQPGLKAVELYDAIIAGQIKALWIMATNPVVSLPHADKVKQALGLCELVVVSDGVRHTDTTEWAHVLLPVLAWGEKDGTVTNSERRISRQRAFLPTPGEAKPDWWILTQIALRMGFAEAAFAYQSNADIFREYAALSGYKNPGSRDFDISGLAKLSDADYQVLSPIQWPIKSPTEVGTTRLFCDYQFFTADNKAHLIAITPRAPVHLPNRDYPFILNTGRTRDQWHTMTRTGKSARLLSHASESYVEIHPQDANLLRIQAEDLVMVSSELGQVVVRVKLAEHQQPGNVFIPMHWNEQNSSQARVGTLIPSVTDPISGQPEFKHTPVKVERYQSAWYGFLLSRTELDAHSSQETAAQPFSKLTLQEVADYWVKIREMTGWRYELAGQQRIDWSLWVRQQFGIEDWLEFQDCAQGRYRCANIVNEQLNICLFIGAEAHLTSRQPLMSLFGKTLNPGERLRLLTGEPQPTLATSGEVICACHAVGRETIVATIRQHGLVNYQQIGEALKAGTGCGSCIPELKALLMAAPGREVA
jgi:assimilatory nitrate reductase catalytic subunit